MFARKWPLLLLLLATAARAEAQQSTVAPDALNFARKTFEAANVAYSAGHYEEARRLYFQVYSITPTANVLHNLGRADLRLGNFVDAARELFACVRADDAQTSLRNSARQALKEAEQHVGKLKVDVSEDGAAVFIDEESFGPSPVPGETAYVSAGRHTVFAHKDGFDDAKRTIEVNEGQTVPIFLRLTRSAAGPPVASPTPQPPSLGPGASAQNFPPAAPSPWLPPPRPESRTAPIRTAVLWAGAGVTVASLAIATGFRLAASSWSTDADNTLAKINSQYGPSACSNPHAAAMCAQLNEQRGHQFDDNRIANITLVGGTLVGVATLGAFLFWRPTSTGSSRLSVVISPAAGGASALLDGVF